MSTNDNTTNGTGGQTEPQRADTRRVRKLRDQLTESGQLHALTADPHLNAVKIERLRVSVTRCMWLFLAVGLGFTTTGVHAFLAGHLTMADPLWWGAWLAEPALAGILITLLRWESEMLSRGVEVADKPVRHLKRLLLGATLVMNVWSAVFPAKGTVTGGNLLLHVVIPVVVYLVAEVMPVIQRTCAAAKDRATTAALAAERTGTDMPAEPAPGPAPTPARPAPSAPRTASALRLPAEMAASLDRLHTQARQQGRPLTPADVQTALRVPADFAARLAAEYHPPTTNGHPVTT
ncbi:hypothetical protein [Crossiella sp. CA198]|uniref:hypothetical protein n=1 Tax=Crossiella sp. CA198 TaxID=3455607 RepID=UPI003F8D6E66